MRLLGFLLNSNIFSFVNCFVRKAFIASCDFDISFICYAGYIKQIFVYLERKGVVVEWMASQAISLSSFLHFSSFCAPFL